jgi:hypothetical protein
MLRKDIQDQYGAIDNLEFGALGNSPTLAGREALIEDEKFSSYLQTAHDDFIEFAAAEQIVGIESRPLLNDTVDWLRLIRPACQLG